MTTKEYSDKIRRLVKKNGTDPAAVTFDIQGLASALSTLDLATREIEGLTKTTVTEITSRGEREVAHPVFTVQKNAQAAVAKFTKQLGLTADKLTFSDEEDPLIALTKDVRKAARSGKKNT